MLFATAKVRGAAAMVATSGGARKTRAETMAAGAQRAFASRLSVPPPSLHLRTAPLLEYIGALHTNIFSRLLLCSHHHTNTRHSGHRGHMLSTPRRSALHRQRAAKGCGALRPAPAPNRTGPAAAAAAAAARARVRSAGNRTQDLLHNSSTSYQLSHSGSQLMKARDMYSRDGARREAKEGRHESHKNGIAHKMQINGFIRVHGGF